MASNRAVQTFRLFLSETGKLNLLPFKISGNEYFNMEVHVIKITMFTSCYCFVGLVINLLWLIQRLFSHPGVHFAAQDYILLLFLAAMDFSALGCLTWTYFYLNDIVYFWNSGLRKIICKFKY